MFFLLTKSQLALASSIAQALILLQPCVAAAAAGPKKGEKEITTVWENANSSLSERENHTGDTSVFCCFPRKVLGFFFLKGLQDEFNKCIQYV